MQSTKILEYLMDLCPEEHAESWDNVGLLVGGDREISSIYIALDATDAVIDSCIEQNCDMLLTHHPLIFSGLKKVTGDDFIGRRVLKLAENEIPYIAMHTNYDCDIMGDLAADRLNLQERVPLLKLDGSDGAAGIGRYGKLPGKLSLNGLSEKISEVFGANGIHTFGNREMMIESLAILPGSGKSGIDAALALGADVLVTGDIDHHSGLDAVARGLAVIDAGHYGLEHIFIEDMACRLRESFPDLCIVEDEPREPFFAL